MRSEEAFTHYHEKSSKWFRENFIDFTVGPGKGRREAHHHKIVDERTGQIGEGFGWSYQDAEAMAWDDLNDKRSHSAKLEIR